MDSSLNDKIFLNIFKKREMRRTKNVKEKEERKIGIYHQISSIPLWCVLMLFSATFFQVFFR